MPLNQMTVGAAIALTAYNVYLFGSAGSLIGVVLVVVSTIALVVDAWTLRRTNPEAATRVLIMALGMQLVWMVAGDLAGDRAECRAELRACESPR